MFILYPDFSLLYSSLQAKEISSYQICEWEYLYAWRGYTVRVRNKFVQVHKLINWYNSEILFLSFFPSYSFSSYLSLFPLSLSLSLSSFLSPFIFYSLLQKLNFILSISLISSLPLSLSKTEHGHRIYYICFCIAALTKLIFCQKLNWQINWTVIQKICKIILSSSPVSKFITLHSLSPLSWIFKSRCCHGKCL